ncbi:hypothetical protein H0H81_001448 [Sphagnurus paluster]|uniref:Uncharacterized protein n=1 Tax=Sphagnurus paluster TaxID=117069 RepID=A0A9P7GH66_9AGAR|nr:hypothetical protein H0H81_001448 [Sphagnurus paluster]
MFSVKATYRGEIRRFSFAESNSFPTFDQLYNQLRRIFPSNNNYYISKLLFFPDASMAARILIAREIRTVEDYSKCLVPFHGRSWPNASLRFHLIDEVNTGATSNFISQTIGQVPWPAQPVADTSSQTQSTLRTMSSFYTPPSPVAFTMPPRAFSQPLDPILVDVCNSRPHTPMDTSAIPPAFTNALQPQTSQDPSSCCSVAQAKTEVHTLLQTFQQDLDCILTRTFGDTSANRNADAVETPHPNGTTNDTSTRSPLSECSTCQKPAALNCSGCQALVSLVSNGIFLYLWISSALSARSTAEAASVRPPRVTKV